MTYNQKRHIQLLKRSEDFKNQVKSFYKESPEESLELSSYNVAVEEKIFWQQRYKVDELMQDFLNRKIDGQEFCDSVFGLRRNHIDTCDKFLSKLVSKEIKEFFPNKESYKLKEFLSSLYFECEHFEMNWDEKTFYNSIRNGFSKFYILS